jgi:hypothetical protein
VTTQFRVAIVAALIGLLIAPMAARAEDRSDDEERGRQACMADAQTYCGQFFPDRDAVGHCLKRNSKRISAACRVLIRDFK